jgi:membrane protease YdiL (CAAX protease family)
MFIEQGFKNQNKFSKYLLGSLFLIGASFIGQIPLIIGIVFEIVIHKKPYPSTDKELMQLFDSNLNLFLMLVSFVFVFLGMYLVVRFLHHQTLLSVTTSRKTIDWKRVFFSFSVWSGFTIVSTFLFYWLSPDDFVVQFEPIPFLILMVISIVLIPIQTSCEEYIFRGYLMQGFGNLARNKWFPLLMTSLIFGFLHYFNPEVSKMGYFILMYYIGTGLFLGIITLMDEGMELALGFHAANNLLAALLVTSDWSILKTHAILKDVSNPDASLEVILPVLIIFPILLWIFSKKYSWNNWKEKLSGKIILIESNVIKNNNE